MPEIPTPSRGPRPNVVTAVVVLLAILLAVVWLGSGGDAAPPVPAGLPAAPQAAIPVAPPQPAAAAAGPLHPAAVERGGRSAESTHVSHTVGRRATRHGGSGGARGGARASRGAVPAPGRAGRTRHGSRATSRAAAPAPASRGSAAPAPEFAIG